MAEGRHTVRPSLYGRHVVTNSETGETMSMMVLPDEAIPADFHTFWQPHSTVTGMEKARRVWEHLRDGGIVALHMPDGGIITMAREVDGS